MHIALRKCNRNVGLPELFVNCPVHSMQHRYPIVNAINKDAQLKVERIVPEAKEHRLRFG